MAYVFYGADTDSVVKKTKETVSLFQAKEPKAAFVVFEDDHFNEAQFEELVSGGQGLFEARCIVLFRRVFENQEAKEAILARIDDIKTTQHIFIFAERKLNAATIALFKKMGAEMKEFPEKGRHVPEKSFAPFALAEAFGKRDKKRAWVVFRKEIAKGGIAESLHGMLFWQIKNMLLAGEHSQVECLRSGMKPFVFSKAQSAAKNFSNEELRALSAEIVSLYHRAHGGEGDLETSTEQFILSI